MVKRFGSIFAVFVFLIVMTMPCIVWGSEMDALVQWGFSRDIVLSGEDRYNAFFLDEEVYRNSRQDLSDLRIVDGKGGLVAYYTQSGYTSRKENRWTYDTELISSVSEMGNTLMDFRVIPVKDTADTPATQLVFDTGNTGFAKNITVYGSYDGIEWQHAMDGRIYNVDSAVKLDLSFEKLLKYKYYRVRIPNNLEKINIRKLQVVYDRMDEDREDYARTVGIEYKLQTEDKSTRIELHNVDHMKLASVRLDVAENFNRLYTAYTKGGGGDESALISGELYNLNFKDVTLAEKMIRFSTPVQEALVVIKIDNKDDQPLQIKNVAVKCFIDKIVFEDKGNGPYKLYYGNSQAQKQSYDLEQYKNLVENETQSLCKLSKPVIKRANAKYDNNELPTALILNIIISASAVLLVLIIAGKLLARKKQ
jgi:hypothetical protein